jgi:hypothetical protein
LACCEVGEVGLGLLLLEGLESLLGGDAVLVDQRSKLLPILTAEMPNAAKRLTPEGFKLRVHGLHFEVVGIFRVVLLEIFEVLVVLVLVAHARRSSTHAVASAAVA